MKQSLALAIIASMIAAGSASADLDPFIIEPSDLDPMDSTTFSVLPSDDPSLFGITGPVTDTGAGVRVVDFDVDPDGNPLAPGTNLTDQYASVGVLFTTNTGIESEVGPGVFGGPASAPNATFLLDGSVIINFTVPVDAVGIINTSPDADFYAFFTGPDGTGTELTPQFQDPGGADRDLFVGGFATGGMLIGSFVITDNVGALELDDLIFRVVPEPTSIALSLTGLVGLVAFARRLRKTHA